MKMPIVTLTTDWGEQGFFAGMVKGALMRLVEGVQVVDICHQLKAHDVMNASFVVQHGCLGFPEGTVHMVDVASQAPFVALRVRGQYFLCSDNGLPSLVFGQEVEEAVRLETQENGIYNFAAYNLFCPAAARLLKGASLSDLGPQHPQLLQRTWPKYVQQGEYYCIYVHHVDSYGNAYLGMTYHEFEQERQGRRFEMIVREQRINEIMDSYYQQHATADPRRKLRLIVSATGLLELAVKESSFVQLIGLRTNDAVILKFKD